MTNPEVAAVAELVSKAPAGTKRSFNAMQADWAQPGRDTFAWAGAEQAVKRFPNLVEHGVVKLGRQRHPRSSYRLTPLGLAVRSYLLSQEVGEVSGG